MRLAYEAWDAVRPQRSLQQRLYFQKQRLAKAKTRLQKRADSLEELEAEVLPKLDEARCQLQAAEEKVQKEQASWEELLWETEDGNEKGGRQSAGDGSAEKAIEKAIETDIGPRLARVADFIDDESPAKPELNLLVQMLGEIVGGSRSTAAEVSVPPQVFSMAEERGGGTKGSEGEKAGPKDGRSKRGVCRGKGVSKEASKAKQKQTKNAPCAQRCNVQPPPHQEGGGEHALAEEARKAGDAFEAAATQLHARAMEARSKAEATMAEPLRTRITELELQARAGGRDLFKDLVSEGVEVDRVSASWIAAYAARYGFN